VVIVFLLLIAALVPIIHPAIPIWQVDSLQDEVVLPKLAATATFTGAALIVAAVQLIRGRLQLPRWPASVWLALAVFVIVNVAAFATALAWRWSLMGEYQRYQGLATTLLYVLLFGTAAVAVRETRDLRWLLLAVYAAGVGTAIYALLQKADLDPFSEHFRNTNRPSATVGQANAFGAYLVAVLGASGFLILNSRRRWEQGLLGAGAVLMLFALLFTQSEGAWLAAFAVAVMGLVYGVIWFAFYRHSKRPTVGQLAAVGAAAVVLAGFGLLIGSFFVGSAPGNAIQNVGQSQDESVGGRISLWRMAARMTIDRPLLGNGQDAFTFLFAEYRDRPDYAGIGSSSLEPESAHNLFLDLASGTGVLGLLAFLALIGAVLWYAGQRMVESADGELRIALFALSAGVIGYLVALLFYFSEAMTTWLLWLLLGAIAGLLAQRSAAPRLAVPAVGLAFAAAGVVALGWAATLIAADLAASQADSALLRSDYAAAERLIDRAVGLNPLMKTYLKQQEQVYETSAPQGAGRAEGLQRALDVNARVQRRFKPSATDVLDQALLEYDLARLQGRPVEETFPLIERAIDMDPYNILLKTFVADFYESQGFEDEALAHRLEILGWQDQ
jgi:O-antigen ligase